MECWSNKKSTILARWKQIMYWNWIFKKHKPISSCRISVKDWVMCSSKASISGRGIVGSHFITFIMIYCRSPRYSHCLHQTDKWFKWGCHRHNTTVHFESLTNLTISPGLEYCFWFTTLSLLFRTFQKETIKWTIY